MTTTTYFSTNSRPCASCQGTLGRCLPTCPDRTGNQVWGEPTMMISGEIELPDGTLMLIPMPQHEDWLTITGVIRAVENGPQSHAEGRNRGPWAPMWALVLVFVGSVLGALGLVFQDPVARMIWEVIHQ